MFINRSLGSSVADQYNLYTWGDNESGKIGNGLISSAYTFTNLVSTGTWTQVAQRYGVAAIKSDGTLWTWGSNFGGGLGINSATTVTVFSPIQVGTDTNWSKVSLGDGFCLALKTNGTLWGWGEGGSGSLGNSSIISRSSPVQIGTDTNWSDIAAGYLHSLAVRTNGTLWAWGSNFNGQLGLGDRTARSSPVQVGARTWWKNVFASNEYFGISAATTVTNALYTWGSNGYGGLGTNTAWSTNKSSPVQVGTLNNWLEVSCNSGITAVKTDGTLWGWGLGGVVGDNTVINRSSPVQIGTDTNWARPMIDGAYGSATGAVKTNGTLWIWGYAYGPSPFTSISGQILSSPVQIGSELTWSTASRAVAYDANNAVAIASNGQLYVRGSGSGGKLGLGDNTFYSTPVQIGSRQWKKVTDLDDSVRALRKDGTLWGWGVNYFGKIGVNNTNVNPSPVQVGSSADWWNISGQLALKRDGSLWSWGYNEQGQLGLGDTINRSSPVQVGTDTDWAFIEGSASNQSFAIKTNGTLWFWGFGDYGSSGLSQYTVYRSSPVQVGTDSNWSYVNALSNVTHLIKTNGTLWACGINNNYILGDGTTNPQSSPVQIGVSTAWKKALGNNYGGIGVRTDGTLWFWGPGTYGTGNNNTLTYSTPVQIGSGTDWNDVSVIGFDVFIARKQNGTLWAWGNNSYGQLGTGDTITRSSPVQIGSLAKWQALTNKFGALR